MGRHISSVVRKICTRDGAPVAAFVTFFVGIVAGAQAQDVPRPRDRIAEFVLSARDTRLGAPETGLHNVVGAAILPNNGIVVADRGNARILVAGSNGHVIRQIGRSGAGPGEFQALAQLAAFGDTLLTWDSSLLRVTRFHVSGEVLGMTGLTGADGSVRDLRAFVSSDEYLVTSRVQPRIDDGTRLLRRTLDLSLLKPSTGQERRIATTEWMRRYQHVFGDQKTGATFSSGFDTPFIGEAVVAACENHVVLVRLGATTADILYHGQSDRSIQLPIVTRVIDRSVVDKYRDSLLQEAKRFRDRFPNQELQIAAAFGPSFPVPQNAAVVRLARVAGRRLWLQEFPRSGDKDATWYGIDCTAGRVDGVLVLPRSWEILGGDESRTLILERDSDDVESVVAYRIQLRPAREFGRSQQQRH